MKKLISVILAISIMVGIASVMASAEGKYDLEFAVAADLHYNSPSEELPVFIEDDPIYWYANRRASMDDESGFIIDEFLNQCAENKDCRYVLIAGDLADDGRTIPDDHRAVAQKLRKFEKETGKQVFVINGNHDASVESNTTYELFKEIYADFGYDNAITEPREDCSYAANLGDKYRLIALDSNSKESTEDGMDAEKLAWVKAQCDSAKADGRYPIVMMHHNILDHMPMQRIISRNFIVKFHYTTAELFANWGVKLVLSGHEHCGDGTSYTSLSGNTIYDFAITSLTMYPIAYQCFKLNDSEIKYERKFIDKIDYDALTSTINGYTKEQLDLMEKGYNEYAKGFLKAGIQYRLELSMSKEKMGIAEDAIHYKAVRTAVDGLMNLLNMPLYGENSLNELAKQYNITLPETGYKTGWDLATDIMAMHYSGEEAMGIDSDNIQLLLKALVTILRVDFADITDSLTLVNIANNALGEDKSISDSITKQCVAIFGEVSAAEYCIMSILAPFVNEFSVDTDGVNDANGTLPGYGTVNFSSNINGIKTNASNILATAKLHLGLVLRYILLGLKVIAIG